MPTPASEASAREFVITNGNSLSRDPAADEWLDAFSNNHTRVNWFAVGLGTTGSVLRLAGEECLPYTSATVDVLLRDRLSFTSRESLPGMFSLRLLLLLLIFSKCPAAAIAVGRFSLSSRFYNAGMASETSAIAIDPEPFMAAVALDHFGVN